MEIIDLERRIERARVGRRSGIHLLTIPIPFSFRALLSLSPSLPLSLSLSLPLSLSKCSNGQMVIRTEALRARYVRKAASLPRSKPPAD
jgi:hypothetical protein